MQLLYPTPEGTQNQSWASKAASPDSVYAMSKARSFVQDVSTAVHVHDLNSQVSPNSVSPYNSPACSTNSSPPPLPPWRAKGATTVATEVVPIAGSLAKMWQDP